MSARMTGQLIRSVPVGCRVRTSASALIASSSSLIFCLRSNGGTDFGRGEIARGHDEAGERPAPSPGRPFGG